MGLGTATIEMESPEEHRERLHDLVKAASAVMVMWCRGGGAPISGRPMVLLGAGDDTTMYVATSLDAAEIAALEQDARVAIVVLGASCALFDGEAAISRDRGLLDALPGEAWKAWWRSKADPAMTVLVISPIEGAYWNGPERCAYQYRLAPPHVARELSDGVPMEI